MIERFELLSQLGKGGMGVVWKARDNETGEIVALKLLHSIYADEPDYVARFEREVEVAQRIHSPHVVEVRGFGVREGVPYMAMEYIEGPSLRELLKARGPFTWDDARPILADVAEGLVAAHAAGVIHRDVKPSNILIAPDGRAKLADFGIARAMDMTRLTGSLTTLGTPAYMAPDDIVDERSDYYSLGCVAYEMLTGAPPFEGESMREVWLKHERTAPNLQRVPKEARAAVAGLLDKDKARRSRAADLRDLRGGAREPVSARGSAGPRTGAESRRTAGSPSHVVTASPVIPARVPKPKPPRESRLTAQSIAGIPVHRSTLKPDRAVITSGVDHSRWKTFGPFTGDKWWIVLAVVLTAVASVGYGIDIVLALTT